MSPKTVVKDLGDLVKIIPKWLRISAVVICASAAFIFTLGSFVGNIVNATTQVPCLQKDISDLSFDTKKQIATLEIMMRNEVSAAYKIANEDRELYALANLQDHNKIQVKVAALQADVKQIDKKTDQILTVLLNKYNSDRTMKDMKDRVVK